LVSTCATLLDHSFGFENATASLSADAIVLLDALTGVFPPNSYPGNVFKNQQRCSQLLSDAGVV